MKSIYLFLFTFLFVTACKQPKQLVNPAKAKSYEIVAITDYESAEIDGFVKPYIDKKRAAFAINAAKFKNQYAAVTFLFNGDEGKYDLQVNALAELDGESQYRIAINNQRLKGTKTNPVIFGKGIADYAPALHIWKKVKLKKNDIIRVEFNSATNGKIPEGNSTAYSRGRFTGISLTAINIK